jgi:PAS domain S-box-containing protein
VAAARSRIKLSDIAGDYQETTGMKSTIDSYAEKLVGWISARKWIVFPLVMVAPLLATGVNRCFTGQDFFTGIGDYVEICFEMVWLGSIAIYLSSMIGTRTKIIETLKESEERYHQLFDLAPDPIVVHRQGMILLANEAAAKSLGLGGTQDLIGKSLLDVIHPDCHAHVTEAIAGADERGVPPMVEIPFVRLDGRLVHGETRTAPTVYKGQRALLSVARDVTERKLVERALKESEEKYRLVVDNAREGIFIVQDGAIQFMNSRVPWFTKYEEGDFEKKSFIEYVVPEDRTPLIEQHVRRMQGDLAAWCHTFRISTNTERIRWLDFTSVGVTWNGKPAALCFAADATTKKRAEEDLRESEKRYRELVDNANDAIYVTDANGFFRIFNPVGLRLTGYSKEEIVHVHYLDLVRPDYKKDVDRFYGIQFVKKMPSTYYELPIHTKQGETVWIGQHVQLVMDGDKVTGFQAICRDITERKRAQEDLSRAEEFLRVMVDNLPIAVFAKSAEDHRFISWNKASENLFGYARGEIIGKNDYDFFPKEQADFFWEKDKDALDSGAVIDIPEEPILTKNTGVRILHTRKVPLRGEAGRPHSLLAISEDVTERKKAEEALRGSEKRYRRLFEDAPLMSVITRNEQGTPFISDCNEFFLHSVGCTREEVVGQPLATFYSPSSQSYLLEGGGYARSLAGEFVIGERELMNRDGRVIPTLLYTATEVDSSGTVTGTRAMFVDITDRKRAENALRESEERFRAIFESVPNSVFIKNRSRQYDLVNPAMLELLALPDSAVLGKTEEQIFGADMAEQLHDLDQRVLTGDRIEEERKITIAGVPMTFLETRVPLRDSAGRVTGICGISHNITERKHFQTASNSFRSKNLSKTMRATFEIAEIASGHDSIVLLTGESGVGKDHLAKYIHAHSKRSKGPYFSINCAAVPVDLAESELFGHESGAFTGAGRRKRGLIELAEGGTLLLNEIGELSPPIQAKLLTFLDAKTFHRVGGEKAIKVNARIIAATSRDLEEEVAGGRFRADLFYRLNVFSIRVPPLRDRREDIPGLALVLIRELAAELRLPTVPEIEGADVERLCDYTWPGNVRELRNVLERGLILSKRNRVGVDELLGIAEPPTNQWSWTTAFPDGKSVDHVADELKAALIVEALRRSKGRRQLAADLLKISRDALKRRIQGLGITPRRKTGKQSIRRLSPNRN